MGIDDALRAHMEERRHASGAEGAAAVQENAARAAGSRELESVGDELVRTLRSIHAPRYIEVHASKALFGYRVEVGRSFYQIHRFVIDDAGSMYLHDINERDHDSHPAREKAARAAGGQLLTGTVTRRVEVERQGVGEYDAEVFHVKAGKLVYGPHSIPADDVLARALLDQYGHLMPGQG